MKIARYFRWVLTVALACAALCGCMAGLNSGGGSSNNMLLSSTGISYGSYPADGDMSVPIDVGFAAITLPIGYGLSLGASDLSLSDEGASSSIASAELSGVKGSVDGGEARYLSDYGLPAGLGGDGQARNAAAIVMPGADPTNADAKPTQLLTGGHTYKLTLSEGTLGTVNGSGFELAEPISITFATPSLYRYSFAPSGSGSYYYVDIAALPELGWSIATGYGELSRTLGGAAESAIYIHTFDRQGARMDDADSNRAASSAILWPADIQSKLGASEALSIGLYGVKYSNGTLFVLGEYGEEGHTRFLGQHGYFVAMFDVGAPSGGYSLRRTSLTVVDEKDAKDGDGHSYDTQPNGLQVDDQKNIFVTGYRVTELDDDSFRTQAVIDRIAASYGTRTEVLRGNRSLLGPFAIIDGGNIYVHGIEVQGDSSVRYYFARYDTNLSLLSWSIGSENLLSTMNMLNLVAVSNNLIIAAGSRMHDVNMYDPLLIVYDASALASGTGAVSEPTAVAEYTRRSDKAGAINIFGAAVLGVDRYSGDKLIYAAGNSSLDIAGSTVNMMVDKFLFDPDSGALELKSQSGSDICSGIQRIALDSDGAIVVAGAVGSASLCASTSAAVWRLDRNLNMVEDAPAQ